MYKLSPDPHQLKILAPSLLCLYLTPSLFQPKILYLPTILVSFRFLLGSSLCLSTISLNALFFEPNVVSIDGDGVLSVRAMELISQPISLLLAHKITYGNGLAFFLARAKFGWRLSWRF